MPTGEHGDECDDRDGGVEQQAVRGQGGVEAAVEEGENHVDTAAQAEAAPQHGQQLHRQQPPHRVLCRYVVMTLLFTRITLLQLGVRLSNVMKE